MTGIVLGVVILFWSICTLFGIEEPNMAKRESDKSVTYTVEMLVVVDYTVYKYWVQRVEDEQNKTSNKHDDVDRRIHLHYESVMRRMSARFSSMYVFNSSFAIDVAISNVIICKTPAEVEWMANYVKGDVLDAAETLSSFRIWLDATEQLPPHDHAMLFTRYDLIKDGSNSVSGLAYTGTICTPSSLSIVEDRMSAQSCTVATHELAHSLGAGHDGRFNLCSSEDNFIMSETTSVSGDLQRNRNSWQFSECSIEYFAKKIAKLNDRGINCLSHRVSQYFPAFSTNNTSNEAETAPSPDHQCQTVEGDYSYLCRNIYKDNYTDFCALMYCSIDELTCNFRLPLDGTTCGNNQVCSAGYCMYQAVVVSNTSQGYSVFLPYNGPLSNNCLLTSNNSAWRCCPNNQDPDKNKCPFGDQPGIVGSLNQDCPAAIAQAPYLCYQDLYMHVCCHSCEQIHTAVPGCEYGDKEEKCKSIYLFDCIFGEDHCCVTCADYIEILKKFVAPVSGGGVAVVMLLILIWKCRKHKSKKKADSQNSRQTERQQNRDSRRVQVDIPHGYSNQAFQENRHPCMNGFRVPGSRHEPVFKFDGHAKIMLPSIMTNKDGNNPYSQSASLPYPGSVSVYPGSVSVYPGSVSVYPGSEVIGQPQPACRRFNLQEFGSGGRPLPSATIPAKDNFHTVSTSVKYCEN